ncbi:MAG: hypothetical protein JRI23_13050, partial [Deltaproteobacteria bacterium]|nr:hypothetical protein [Deltaproteobacteria bacterium]MBW2532646.1 hypothetical protein [Deltaproteobacteria bacterium]
PDGFICRYDTCIPDLGTCQTHDDCPGDSYCDANGECIPYGVPPDVVNDPECQREDIPPDITPVVQCEWTGPPSGDPTETFTNVYTAPMVADLNLDNDPNKLQPSIVVTTFASQPGVRNGMLRVFDGRTCAEQLRLGGPDDPEVADNRPGYGSQWAIADLDGDVPTGGHPELVGLHNTGISNNSHPLNLYAIAFDASGPQPTAARLWTGRDCGTSGQPVVSFATNTYNFGPGIWDLNDDGSPEIVLDQMVFDAQGCLLSSVSNLDYLSLGVMSAVADVDLDGSPELVRYDRIARWDTSSTDWVDEAWFTASASHLPGHVAIADLGAYSTIPGHPHPNQLPEIIVVSAQTTTFNPSTTGTIRVQTLDGTVVWGPVDLHHDVSVAGGHGGPPTASDFDGDGQVEFAAAANQYYAVYDPDCEAALGGSSPAERPGGQCVRVAPMDALPDGILWAQPSQDFSSSATGSSVFDFNGDGAAEAVYADECYVRVYEGATGQVIFSAPASSGTGYELPVIVDADGDYATEIVVSRAGNSPDCPDPDPLFPSATGFTKVGGFAILRDPEDRWAASRPIWNQHAYSVTHIEDDATAPSTSNVTPNWTDPDLNNFRQNTQGNLGMLDIADLTVVFTDVLGLCAGDPGTIDLEARVCNRGTNPVQDGVLVEFVESASDIASGSVLCDTTTTSALDPGECEVVSCTGDVAGLGNVFAVVDPADTIADCHPGNNDGPGAMQLCPE